MLPVNNNKESRHAPPACRLTTSLLACACALPGPALAAKKTYFRVGNAVDATAVETTAGTVLMGGSTDVDAAFQWLCDRAAGGDFLVVRAAGTDAYNPYVQELCPASIPWRR